MTLPEIRKFPGGRSRRNSVCARRAHYADLSFQRKDGDLRRRSRRALNSATSLAGATRISHESDVLLAIDIECDWGAHAGAQSTLEIEELGSIVCAIREKMTIASNVKHKISCCRQSAATAIRVPAFLLRDRIPCQKNGATLSGSRSRADGA